jgi:broad specificity phosphatase PhoE
MLRRFLLRALPLLVAPSALIANDGGADPWRRLKAGGHVVLIRHAATVPGIGDPPGFRLDSCSTQRNLSGIGRDSARRIGAAFRGQAVPIAEVLSSRWCRCIDTAQLAFGRASPAPMIDSMFNDDDATRERKLREVRSFMKGYRARGNLILVTHDVNIRALVGESVAQGEMVLATIGPDGSLPMVGMLALPAA